MSLNNFDEKSNDFNRRNQRTEQGLPFPTTEQESDPLKKHREQIAKSYEAVMAICAYAEVPTAARHLIDALVRLSEGEVLIKATDFQIASVFYRDENKRAALKKKVQRWRKALDKWQTDTDFTLVQIRSGFQKSGSRYGSAAPEYEPSQYRLIILEMAATVVARNDQHVNTAVLAALGQFPDLPSRLDEPRKNPLTVDRCLNTGTSWFRKTLEIAQEDGELKQVVRDMQADTKRLIEEFLTDGKAGGETDASHLEPNSETNLDTRSTIVTSSFFNNASPNKGDDSRNESSNGFSAVLPEGNASNIDNLPSADSTQEQDSPDATLDSIPRTASGETTKFSMLEQALSHAGRGFRVFPVYGIIDGVCSCRYGADCPTQAKHPCVVGWKNVATTDEAQIRTWWRKFRTANIGIATGDYNEDYILVVLDVDTKSSGFESLEVLEKEFGKLPETLTAITGGKGRHYMFLVRRGFDIRNIQASRKLGSGLDIRGIGGFIAAVGSLHVSGNRYEWVDKNAPIAEMPEWMIEKLTAPVEEKATSVAKSSAGESVAVSFSKHNGSTKIIQEHEGRNDFLFKKALGYFHGGRSKTSVAEEVASWNNSVCRPPVGKIELEKLIDSAEKTYRQRQ